MFGDVMCASEYTLMILFFGLSLSLIFCSTVRMNATIGGIYNLTIVDKNLAQVRVV